MTTLTEIETLCRRYAEELNALDALTERIQYARRKAVHDKLQALKQCVSRVSACKDEITDALASAPALFEKPRTRSFDGIKVGFRKQKGKVVLDDEPATILRIRERLPVEQAELLIRIKESVVKEAVNDLTAADLKRLGIRLTQDTDEPVINAARTDLDKLVDALLEDGAEA